MKMQLNLKSNVFIFIATISCIIGGLMNWFDTILVEMIFSASLIVIIGLPHGATDLLLFEYLVDEEDTKGYLKFLTVYLGLIAIYGLIWFLFPKFALLAFILISVYHFGQSNWNFIKMDNQIIKSLMYCLSGSFVLLIPLCIHHDLTFDVIKGITGITVLSVNNELILSLPRALFILNIWALFYFYSKEWLSKKALLLQVSNLILLMFAFYSLPLILGFTVYFVFWHSFGSMIDQLDFIKRKEVSFTWLQYFKNALPTTIIAILFIISCVGLNIHFELGFTLVQIFFVILSLFTLPHILLIEQIYGNEKVEIPEVRYN